MTPSLYPSIHPSTPAYLHAALAAGREGQLPHVFRRAASVTVCVFVDLFVGLLICLFCWFVCVSLFVWGGGGGKGRRNGGRGKSGYKGGTVGRWIDRYMVVWSDQPPIFLDRSTDDDVWYGLVKPLTFPPLPLTRPPLPPLTWRASAAGTSRRAGGRRCRPARRCRRSPPRGRCAPSAKTGGFVVV